MGRVALFDKAEGDFSFSNFTAALRVCDPRDLDFRFLHKFLYWTYVSGVTEGMQSHSTGIRNLDGDAYKSIKFAFPPLPEQQRIVGILDEAFDGIASAKANAERNLQNARALFECVLNVAIQGKLIPQNSRDISVAELISEIEKARNVAIHQGRAKPEKTDPVEPNDEGDAEKLNLAAGALQSAHIYIQAVEDWRMMLQVGKAPAEMTSEQFYSKVYPFHLTMELGYFLQCKLAKIMGPQPF